jgi:hypothetical protein
MQEGGEDRSNVDAFRAATPNTLRSTFPRPRPDLATTSSSSNRHLLPLSEVPQCATTFDPNSRNADPARLLYIRHVTPQVRPRAMRNRRVRDGHRIAPESTHFGGLLGRTASWMSIYRDITASSALEAFLRCAVDDRPISSHHILVYDFVNTPCR